ncbi:hypothetical protein HOLleu_02444 [Holothuria leucospilota]|uniref:Uncharacterized protein n=1 Tax=Holothuria leucospilota TaxID=206669 RepID=A0A9Q1HKV8_HOLLE|nr:hypothetical protein HOLleu_02444 [Holothuria leucospilota]
MKFKRVPFGNNSSSFLLNATIKHHLAGSGIALTELEENLYVDDLLTGDDVEEEVCKLFRQSKTIMNRAGMSFAKGASSSKMVTQTLFKEFGSKHLDVDSVKILGLT